MIAVGGCYAEAQRERLFDLYPFVDVAFGPGTIPHLAEWLGAGGQAPRSSFGTGEEREFAGTLPMHRERRFQAWVQVSMGCNSVCSYCIVPAVRGREVSRRPGEILAEVTGLAREGVREITLLGQNVNSWGRDLLPDVKTEFGELLRACDAVDGIERIRFTSPHPKDFRREVIAAMAECDAVCEHAHLPLQSGSTRILKAMRRTYGRERYLRLVDELRAAIPDLALTTDIIVGFPGETERDFEETLEVVEEVGYDGAFTFVYSPRQGTEAASMPDQVPEEIEARADRASRRARAARRSRRETASGSGGVEEVLVEGPSRTDPALAARAHPPKRDRQLRGTSAAGRPRRRPDRRRDLDDPQGHRAGGRCSVVATSSGTACSTSATSAAIRPRTATRPRSARSSAPTASASSATRGGGHSSTTAMKTVVDLRTNEELEADPPAELPVEVLHIPFLETDRERLEGRSRASSTPW